MSASKIIIITGANAGIGKVTARELAKTGATIIMVCRSQERGGKALAEVKSASGNEQVHLMLCDLSSQASIRTLANEFLQRFERLDVLVNNAGAVFNKRIESVDGYEMTFALNHMGYFLLTKLLLERLKASAPSRIVNVSSMAHQVPQVSFDDLQRTRNYRLFNVYGETKLMNILFTYELARRLEGTGVTVNALHPGFVRTNFGRSTTGLLGKLMMPIVQLMAINEDKGAETSIYLASSPEVEGVTGKYWDEKKAISSIDHSYDEAIQKRLWDVSEAMIV